jgi:hypothetical protein
MILMRTTAEMINYWAHFREGSKPPPAREQLLFKLNDF